jgi:protein-tyrosine-phosphatase
LLWHEAGNRFEVASAGTKPGSVRPEAIAVMNEIGIDISAHRSKSVDEFADQTFDYVLTVCDNAKETCPIFPVMLTGFTRTSRTRLRPKVPRKPASLSSVVSATRFVIIFEGQRLGRDRSLRNGALDPSPAHDYSQRRTQSCSGNTAPEVIFQKPLFARDHNHRDNVNGWNQSEE